jgi:hypothetical protein
MKLKKSDLQIRGRQDRSETTSALNMIVNIPQANHISELKTRALT